MAAPILQFKRGSAGVAGTVPALRPGEPAFSLNNFDFFIGFDTSVSGNKFFGSHRYWKREDGVTSLRFALVDKDGNNNIQFKSPDTLSGITTYTFPETPIDTYILTTDSDGNLNWGNSLPAGIFLTGITTFIDITNNVLGDENTGSVQIDGGVGIAKNLTVKENFYVGGTSEFIGIVTFRGGTINLGDSDSDNVYVGGEFISSLNPNDDASYDIGFSTQRWRNAYFSGIATFNTGSVIDDIQIGISSSTEIDTSVGELILDSADGNVVVDDNLIVTGKVIPSLGSSVTDGITWPLDPGGGSGDVAFIRYYVQSGEDTRLHIGIRDNNGSEPSGADDLYLEAAETTITGDLRVNGSSVMGQATIDNIRIGVANDNEIDTTTGSLTLDSANGNTIIDDNLTVTGNLFIQGSTTQLDTTSLTIEDRTIELGRVDGNTPGSATTWDLGVLFNYNDGADKKSAVIWESADSGKSNISIFKFATIIAADTDGTDLDTPQLSVTTYAPIEIASLWVNNNCTGGAQEVIGCLSGELNLQNITIDAGSF
jgi:hypothetical protein